MRNLIFAMVLVGCGSNKIGSDPTAGADGGGKDAADLDATFDGSPGPDGSSAPDGSTGPEGGTPAKPALYTSGSRLKVKYYTGADGSKSQIGLYDTTLQTACYFSLAADNTPRCLPAAVGNFYFSDVQCSVRVLTITKSCAAPKYASFTTTTGSCASTVTHIASVTGATSPAKLYYLSGTTCTDAGAASSAVDYYGVGAEIPPSTFVQGTEMQEP